MNRVVITGMGIWSCIGTSLDEVRDALYAGKSGIILDPIRKEAGFRSGLVGNVPKADLKALLPAIREVICTKRASMPIWPPCRL